MAKRTTKQLTVPQFRKAFGTEDACRAYLQTRRWSKGVRCPRCNNAEVYELPSRPFHWQCQACDPQGYRFSVLVGTIFENTNMPLTVWFEVIYMMLTAKKGVSALQIHRTLVTGSYRTAWSMCHRIRVGLQDEDFRKLVGIVEVDETYIGGKPRGPKEFRSNKLGRSTTKTVIAGAVSRKGGVVAKMVANVKAEALHAFVKEAVSNRVSVLITDQWSGYNKLNAAFPQHKVINKTDAYVVGAIHTNTIEGFWSILKRGLVGTFHKVSDKYLPLYIAEFSFRYNNRNNPNIFAEAIGEC
jgi:transposase-like protein